MPVRQPVRPWGMSRATPPLPEAPPPWVSVHLDPETQLTIFSDEQGKPVDIFDGTATTFATVSKSKPHDGAQNAPERPDDSPADPKKD
jgi:putative ATP-grasp target RiPP